MKDFTAGCEPCNYAVRSVIDTRNGTYEIRELSDGTYRILLNDEDKHGVCSANDVIAFLSNALHNAEFKLM